MIDATYDQDKAARIVATIEARMAAQSPLMREMLEVQRRYDGNVVAIPLPEVDGNPTLPKTTPLLIANAIDDVALAAAQVRPMISSPALDPGKATGSKSRQYARIRTSAMYATWRQSHMDLLMRRAYRQLTGYATFAMIVVPTEYGPCIELREALASYPDPRAPEDPSPPTDAAFVFQKSAAWLRYMYPDLRKENGGPIPETGIQRLDEMWSCFEWVDAEETVMGLMGPSGFTSDQAFQALRGRAWRILTADVNRVGYAPCIVPRRASMSRISAQVAQLTGLADLMDKLMALDIAAQEKAIFPDRYVISAEGRAARLQGGRWVDGRTGDTNVVEDAASVGQLVSQPSPMTEQLVDRLERNFTRSMGTVPQMRGETYGALRTGRGIDALYGVSIDPRVQEAHEIAQAALGYLFKTVGDTYKAYWPSKTFSLTVGRQADVRIVDFTPAKHLETTTTVVEYAIPGADATQLTVALGQLSTAGLLSKQTARKLHPWIGDPEGEENNVVGEAFDEALIQGVIKGVMTTTEPGLSPAMLYAARMKKKVVEGIPVEDAIDQAWREVQEEQAQQMQAPPGVTPPEMMPGMAGLPMPGGGMVPPNGAPQAQPTPPPDQGMAALLAAMQAVPPRGAAPGPPMPQQVSA